MTFTHPRRSWVAPAPPITGPPIDWTRVDTVVIHYTAADDLIDGDPGESVDRLDDYLRQIQSSYTRTRGYSVGYHVAVDWLGGTWEMRGFDIRCAANKGHNDHTFAVLLLVDGNDAATHLAAAAVRDLITEATRHARRPLAIVGHGQLRNPNAATQCPGLGLRSQIAAGAFTPTSAPPTEPPAPVPTLMEDDMAATLWQHPKFLNVFLIGAGPAVNVSPAVFASLRARGVPHIVDAHDQLLAGCISQSGLTLIDLVPTP